jgi:uncharacterized phage protein (TIGR02218 family)
VIRRIDGVTQGFTDHDEDVALGDVVCRAGSGLLGSEATQKLGFSADSSEIAGALADDTLNEDDLAAGRYDSASVEVWLADWTEPDLRVLLAKGTLGEVRREGPAFSAEVRGQSERLSQDSGRLYTSTCATDLGDRRCGIDLADPAFRGSGSVSLLNATSSFTASGLEPFDDDWFSAGKLTFTSGANAGVSVEVKHHRKDAAVTIELWQAMPEAIAAGDTFVVTAGCDKRFQTCHDRFNNLLNFRGFPHIPGNDFVISYPLPGQPGNDGASRQS